MTECLDVAFGYTQNKIKDSSKSPLRTIFVNEVLESEKLKVVKFKTIIGSGDTYEELHQFRKHQYIESQQPTRKGYKKDSLGRMYRSFSIDGNLFDEYVARDSLTIPRYLIVFQPKKKNRIINSINRFLTYSTLPLKYALFLVRITP